LGHGGLVEGTGKVVEGAHSVGAELVAVLRGRRGARVAIHGGSVIVSKVGFGVVKRVEEEEMGGRSPWRCTPLIGARGGGRWRQKLWAGAVVAAVV
jgi:hypothetical protein